MSTVLIFGDSTYEIRGRTRVEITRLYMLPVFIAAMISEVITLPLDNVAIKEGWEVMVRFYSFSLPSRRV